MEMETGKTLTNEEVIRELLELLKKNAMKDQANDVFEICSYVDGLEKKIDSMTEELTNMLSAPLFRRSDPRRPRPGSFPEEDPSPEALTPGLWRNHCSRDHGTAGSLGQYPPPEPRPAPGCRTWKEENRSKNTGKRD